MTLELNECDHVKELKIQPALNSQLVPAHLQQASGAEQPDSSPPQDSQDKQVTVQLSGPIYGFM
jgi:hypothetical protein